MQVCLAAISDIIGVKPAQGSAVWLLSFGQQNLGDRYPAFVNDFDISLKSIIIRHGPRPK
jgi:hypothetical protein